MKINSKGNSLSDPVMAVFIAVISRVFTTPTTHTHTHAYIVARGTELLGTAICKKFLVTHLQ